MLNSLETELRLRGLSSETIKTYMFYNQKFLEFIKKEPNTVSEQDIRDYLSHMIGRKVSNATLALSKSALLFFYNEVLKQSFAIKTPKIPKQVPVVLTKGEVRHMIERTENKKHRLLLEFIYSTGIRLNECVSMKINNLELDEKIGWVRSGKGAKDRMIVLSDRFIISLREYLQNRKISSEYIFATKGRQMSKRAVQKIVSLAAERAEISKKVHPHTLRHSYATHLLEAGVDIRKIQTLLGHSNLNTTERYTHISNVELKKIKNPLDELLS